MAASARCVVLVPSARAFDSEVEAALAELSRRRYPVWRAKSDANADVRDRLTEDALAAGFEELLFIDPSIVFEPDDAERLRARGLPVACAVYALPGRRQLSCEFFPSTRSIRFGRYGAPIAVQTARLGFALVRRTVFDAIRQRTNTNHYFAPDAGSPILTGLDDAAAFCNRVRACGLPIVADTAIRVWKIGSYRYSWEDAGRAPERHEDYTFFPSSVQTTSVELIRVDEPLPTPGPATRPHAPRERLRPDAEPLKAGFPSIRAYVVTYPANRDCLALTLASFAASDWGKDLILIDQPADWTPGGDSAPNNYKHALEAAAADDCDFSLICEDDIRVSKHLRHNLLASPLVQRDQCDYFSLFLPDTMADPWLRHEPHLGYRLAKPRYGGPDRLWEKHRVWGVQAILMSRRLVRAALARWDRLQGVQDARLLGVCGELHLPLYYASPCWVDHAPMRSGYNTPLAYAADFDPGFRLEVRPGFQPPEAVPGWLTRAEGELLAQFAAGLDVLEIGAASGRTTVCLAQTPRRVVAVDATDLEEAAEWLRRFGLTQRVAFRTGRGWITATVRFGLGVVSARDGAGLARDLNVIVKAVTPGGLIAVQNYPDPAWPDVRLVVDELARKFGWKRIAQADYVGVFRK